MTMTMLFGGSASGQPSRALVDVLVGTCLIMSRCVAYWEVTAEAEGELNLVWTGLI